MGEYKYSVPEIDRMRCAIKTAMNVVKWTSSGTGVGGGADDKIIEDRLRTFMLNGTSAEELENAAIEAEKKSEFRRLSFSISKEA